MHYELRKYIAEDGKNKIQNGSIKFDLVSNSGKVAQINFDDSTFIGVEIAVFPLVQRGDTTLIFEVLYYEPSLDNKWIPISKRRKKEKLYFETKMIYHKWEIEVSCESEDVNMEDIGVDDYPLVHAVYFEKKKLR